MAQYESDTRQSESVSEQVVEAVAAAHDVDPLELPPLYDVVDPDALNRFFDHDAPDHDQRVAFTVAGCEVVVDGSGEVEVTAMEESPASPSVVDGLVGRDGAEPTF